ncbi:hypothetical protein ACX3V1_14115, partial [Escherichia coli]
EMSRGLGDVYKRQGRIRAEDPAQAYRDSLAWVRTC